MMSAIRVVAAALLAVVLLPPTAGQAQDALRNDEAFVRSFLREHCVRCHNATTKKGAFELHDLKTDIGGESARFAAILERLRAGDMPPEKEPRPDRDTLKKMIDVVQSGLGRTPAGVAEALEVPVRPGDGNHVPHSLLFGGTPGPSVPPPPRLWRLSPEGYAAGFLHAVQVGAQRIPQPFGVHGDPGIKDYAALYWIDEGSTDILMRNAERIVEILTGHQLSTPKGGGPVRVSPTVRTWNGERIVPPAEFVPLLHPEIAPKRAELEAAIRVLYRMVLVREPSADELDALVALHAKCALPPGDLPSAGKTMLMAPLLSAEALHRFEVGRGAEVRPGVRMLAPDELAFAVSLAFSGRREPGLFDAAAKGGLTSKAEVAAHVRRILGDPQIDKPRLLGFFHEYFGYDRAPEVCKDAQPDYVHHADQLVLDTDLLVLSILEKDRDVLRELLTTRKSFVNGASLKVDGQHARPGQDQTLKNLLARKVDARIEFFATDKPAETKRPRDKFKAFTEAAYGFAEWPANQPVDLPGDRIGVLMQPSWLVAWSSNFFNDPVRRGLWIREHLLGDVVPRVPVGVVIVLPDDPTRTLRQRMQITRDQACWKCHRKIDDLGFPFESFDHFGRPRDREITVDEAAVAENRANAARRYAKGEPRPEKKPERLELPLSTTGMIVGSGDPQLDGPVENAAEMIRRLAASDRARQVFVRYAFRYFLGRNETVGDAATLQAADRAYVESGGSFRALVESLLTSESFLYRTVPDRGAAK